MVPQHIILTLCQLHFKKAKHNEIFYKFNIFLLFNNLFMAYNSCILVHLSNLIQYHGLQLNKLHMIHRKHRISKYIQKHLNYYHHDIHYPTYHMIIKPTELQLYLGTQHFSKFLFYQRSNQLLRKTNKNRSSLEYASFQSLLNNSYHLHYPMNDFQVDLWKFILLIRVKVFTLLYFLVQHYSIVVQLWNIII